MPKVSAVIPAHDEAATIAGVIQPLHAVDLICEVIVVDDASNRRHRSRRARREQVLSMP